MNYLNDIDGWMADTELQWLYSMAKEMETIVEIGSWKGRSTHALLSGCLGIVWAVDHFQGSIGEEETRKEARERDVFEDFKKNVGHFENLRIIKADSIEAAKQFGDKSIDMVFIDGGHNYEEVKNDITTWLPKTKKIICGHDYGWPSVKQAVIEVFDTPDILYESIWVKKLIC